ncbi:hypothetical protein KM043_017360 [Ampulex compressa]|nr:hypothetical protein KM043_017360 [Ampulex compressa]
MDDKKPFVLNVWKGDWGLPSVNSECLQVLAYAKFSGVPLKVNVFNNLYDTPNGSLPVLKYDNRSLDKVRDIIELFRGKEFNSDYTIDNEQCGDTLAYEALLKECLVPAIQCSWWLDKSNVDELIRPWFTKALPFPFNFYYTKMYERRAQMLMESLYPMEDDAYVIQTEVYSKAQKCLAWLSTRLGKSEFFFGAQPTSLDAIVYSYLAPLMKIPLKNPTMQNHLKTCTNLTRFVSRITQRYFEAEHQEYEKRKADENAQKLRRDSELEFPNKRRNQILAGLFAALAMIGYALSTGIVEGLMYILRRRKFVKLPKKLIRRISTG